MQRNPAISVVIPMYNAEKFIRKAIGSVLDQTFENFEVIIVDDKSTDRSLEIVQQYQEPRIKILQQIKNSGKSDSRNLGLINSRGKYVYFMDADDLLLPECLETFFVAMEESNSDVVYMNAYWETEDEIDATRMLCANPTPRFFSNNLAERLQKEYVYTGVIVTPWIKIFRREFLYQNQITFPPVTYFEDSLLKLKELCFSKRTLLIDACGYVYRQHPEQSMNWSAESIFKKAFESIPSALKYVHEILSSERLISPLSDETKIGVETEIIFKYFRACVVGLYRTEKIEHIDKILDEILVNVRDPDVTRNLVHTLALAMLQQGSSDR